MQVNVVVYQGLLQVAAELANPARRTPSGFPLPEYMAFVSNCTRDVLSLRDNMPFRAKQMPPKKTPDSWTDSVPILPDAPYADPRKKGD